MRNGVVLAMVLTAGLAVPVGATNGQADPAASHPAPQGAQLDLTGPFHTRSPWYFVVTEGPAVKDYGGNDAPGALTLCLRKGLTGTCNPDPVTIPLHATSPDAPLWEPHYLIAAKVVHPRGKLALPLLMIVTRSLNSGDGNQVVATQLIRYLPARDAFDRVFVQSTGHNNNEEIRFVDTGPLRGSVITAEPEEHLPYGYWIVVNKAGPTGIYRPVMRYRSATIYNDGNPLAVIDSEMPNIEQHLGLWKPGDLLPTPQRGGGDKPCLKPTLKHGELWCT